MVKIPLKPKLSHPGHLFITGEIIIVMIDAAEKFSGWIWVIVCGVTYLIHFPRINSYFSDILGKLEADEKILNEEVTHTPIHHAEYERTEVIEA